MSKKLIIFPFGGNAREALLSIFAINKVKKTWEIVGFLDDNKTRWGKDCCGIKVLGNRSLIKKYPNVQILAIPGNPDNYLKREDLIESLNIDSKRFVTIIHPSVTVSSDASIGYNTLLMSGVFVGCNVKIGNHCVILPNSVASHDSYIADYCCIGSNVSVSSDVNIGPMCYIGSGVKIREKIIIGERVLLGLGANVISDIESGVVAVGNPACVIRKVEI